MIRTKRIYEPADAGDGFRVLVDRVWPRGVSKAEARIDEWLKEVAPSTALRQWFAHDPAKWAEFKRRYWGELAQQAEPIGLLHEMRSTKGVTLLYGARDEWHNNAVALKEYLEGG
jgi:uncharacterized protein YeaO (DUF488 family)